MRRSFCSMFLCVVMSSCATEQKELTPSRHAAIGFLAGGAEGFLGQPISFFKDYDQMGEKIPRNPVRWFDGVTANMNNMAWATLIQFYTARALESCCDDDPTVTQKIGIGIGAGCASAPACSLTEYCKLIKEKDRVSARKAIPRVVEQQGVRGIMRGLSPVLIREASYTVGYVAFIDVLYPHAKKITGEEYSAHAAATILSGLIAGGITQPCDTVKVRWQSDWQGERYKHLKDVASELYVQEGIAGFYRGAPFRLARICTSFFVLDFFRRRFTTLFEQHDMRS